MIFITGCTGLVGSHLVATLICKQQLESESISLSVNKSISSESESESIVRVKLLCRNNSDLSLLNDVLKRYGFNEIPSNIEFVYGDVLDYDILEAEMKDVDEVYHCAAVVSFDPSDKGSLMRVNVEGTRNMVNAALHCGVKKFCHVSSIAALGRALEGEPINENSPWSLSKNNSIYSISKHEAEMEVWRGIAEGLNATIVNPSLILGAGRWNSSSCELFNVIAKGFPFYTTGVNGFVDVKDVARAMIMLMENNKFGQRYCLNGALISYQYLFNLMAQNFNVKAPYIKVGKSLSEIAWRIFWLIGKIQGKKPLITKETARTATRKYSYSSEKIIRELKFKFTPIEESIKEICSIYKTQNS
ncbi:MAG: NAD-dependent epimerase/dehydratase family protein [Bacteroidales bacterium]|nr:NAD-dependent epimerase/dehydratase family protein [Bacteroidales bacterium]